MKHVLTAFLCSSLLSLTISIQAQETPKKNNNVQNAAMTNVAGPTMQGAYYMLMQVVNDGTRDSMLNIQQLKLYTDRHFIYAHALPGDSLAYYGIGSYKLDNDQLTEYPFYTAVGGAHDDTVSIRVTKMPDGYVQVISFPPDSQGKKYVMTEEYRSVSKPVTSPLDGAWKQTKTTFIPKKGAPVSNNDPTQFKVFQSGHFLWASTYLDSTTQKPASTFGYGTFEMNGRNKIKELTTNSTFKTALVGTPVMVQLKFIGNDTYQQTIDWPTGKSVEEYQRLK